MSTLKIKAPKAPLKGKGNKREPFNFRANYHADALRVAFWDALPPEHKTVACVGIRAKGYHSFGKFISPEAMTVFRKAVLSEAEDDVFATLLNYPMSQSIQISKSIQSKPAQEAQEKASDQTQPTAEELRAASAILNRASLKSNARKGFGTPAVKKKADATRARNSEIRRRLRREAIARAKLEAKAIIAKLDAEEKARGDK